MDVVMYLHCVICVHHVTNNKKNTKSTTLRFVGRRSPVRRTIFKQTESETICAFESIVCCTTHADHVERSMLSVGSCCVCWESTCPRMTSHYTSQYKVLSCLSPCDRNLNVKLKSPNWTLQFGKLVAIENCCNWYADIAFLFCKPLGLNLQRFATIHNVGADIWQTECSVGRLCSGIIIELKD